MTKSLLARLGAVSLLLITLQANAVTINGINYKIYPGSGTKCPDGSNVFVYNKVRYCKAYRANLSWSIPTTRTNGTALPMSELAGYEAYWTRSGDNASGTMKLNSNTAQTTAFDFYQPGTYYFAVSAIDTKGLKSPLSKMVQKSLGP